MKLQFNHVYNIALTRKETKEGTIDIDIERFKAHIEDCSIQDQDDIEELLDEYIWDYYNGELVNPIGPNEEPDDLNTDKLNFPNIKDIIEDLNISIKVVTCCDKTKQNWSNFKFCPDCGKELIY